MKKKLLYGIICVITTFLSVVVVNAATKVEKVSYLNMGTGASHQGSNVNHTYSGIRFNVNSVISIEHSDLPNKLMLRLYKKNLIGSTFKAVKVMNIGTNFGTQYSFGTQGSGKYYYVFKTCPNTATNGCSTSDQPYSGFNADNVDYSSYN